MTFAITVQKRTPGNAEAERAMSLVPGVVYGPGVEPQSISLDSVTFDKLYESAGQSNLIDFTVEGNGDATKVLIQDVQFDPVKGVVTHVDFRQINMNEKMTATVPLEFVGESTAVKEGGTLVKAIESLTVTCLPKDLVSNLEISLDALVTFEDTISVKDVTLPEGLEVAEDVEATIATVSAPLTEEQLQAMEESNSVGVEDVEVEEKGKKEEGEEGEAASEEKKEEKKEEK